MRAEKWMEAVMKELGSLEEKVKEEKLSIVMACASDDGENLCMSLKIMGDVANIADMLNSALIAHIKEAGVSLEDAVDGLRKCWRAMNEAEG